MADGPRETFEVFPELTSLGLQEDIHLVPLCYLRGSVRRFASWGQTPAVRS